MEVNKNPVEQQLRGETEKWLAKINKERKKIKLVDESRKDFLKNIDAYIADCGHFMKEGKLVLAFEAVIWSWAWLSIGKEMGILK